MLSPSLLIVNASKSAKYTYGANILASSVISTGTQYYSAFTGACIYCLIFDL